MEKITKLLAIIFLLASCQASDSTGTSVGADIVPKAEEESPAGAESQDGGSQVPGEIISSNDFSNANKNPMNTELQKIEMTKILNWMETITNGNRQKIYAGTTKEGKSCELYLTNYKYDTSFTKPGLYYVSLGTTSNESKNSNTYTYVGMFLENNESVQFNNLKFNAQYILMNHTQNDPVGNQNIDIKNEVVIYLNPKGQPKSARGRSSYWPYSTCILK